MNEIANCICNHTTVFWCVVGALGLGQILFYLCASVKYETRTGRAFWIDRLMESIARFSKGGKRKAKWIFILTSIIVVGIYIYGACVDASYSAANGEGWLSGGKLGVVIALGVLSLLSALLWLLFTFLVHADTVKFTLPIRGILLLSALLGLVYGGYAICHRPGISDGVLSGLLWKAFTLKITDDDIKWLTSVDFRDIGVYVRSFFYGTPFWVAISVLLTFVLYELLVRHVWIYSRPLWRRAVYPIMCVMSAVFFMGVFFAIGFVGFGYAFVLVCYLISFVVAIFIGYVAIAAFLSGAKDAISSSGGGYSPAASSTSYGSSSSSSSESEPSGKFTAIDDLDREYYGKGDTMYRDTPGDNGTFDRHNDGTWTSRYGDEVLREKGPGD